MITALLLSILLLIFAASVRLVPHFLAPHGLGVDHWFWKAYIEKYWATRQFPPELPQFVLDREQWYPPLFPLAIAHLPLRVFDRYSHLVAAGIDLIRMSLLLWLAWVLTRDWVAVVAAGVVYATVPILVSYNTQLNPRGLGALLLDVLVALTLVVNGESIPLWMILPLGLVGGLILLAHKMTTQLFWFLGLTAFALTLDWHYLGILALSVAMALAMSKGFYVKVARAHWDIVSFWNANWPWLTAHPVRESPVYREVGYETPTKYHRTGFVGWLRRAQYLGAFNPYAWVALIVGGVLIFAHGVGSTTEGKMLVWLALVLTFVLLTTIVPFMKCLGNGYLYLYNAAAPAGLVWGLVVANESIRSLSITAAFIVSTVIAGVVLWFYFRTLRASKTLKVDEDMDAAVSHLRQLPDGLVMCLPPHWNDVVAYRTGKSVLWGAHGYGFKQVQPIFPRLLKPIGQIVSEYHVRYLVSYNGYLPENFLADMPASESCSFGDYVIYTFV